MFGTEGRRLDDARDPGCGSARLSQSRCPFTRRANIGVSVHHANPGMPELNKVGYRRIYPCRVIAEDGREGRACDLPIDENARHLETLEGRIDLGVPFVAEGEEQAVDASLLEEPEMLDVERWVVDGVGKHRRIPGRAKGGLGAKSDL